MTSNPDCRYGGGGADGPISPDAWKRAVYKRPPHSFHIQLLPPEKQGHSYSYGFRVHAVKNDNASSITTHTTSSHDSVASLDEYDVWRRWEDCLWLQDTLEVEYARAARAKRNRLAAGKGVKKNGIYIHSDQAASWESLPFGPNPSDIALDIHQHIPKLSKKGTIFRASQETVAHRYEDLQKMMGTLLQDDLPTLIKEIKGTRTFTDFFGIWRRDIDLARKTESLKKCATDQSQASLSTSKRSIFLASPPSFPLRLSSTDKGKSPERVQAHRTSTHSDSSSSEDSVNPSRSGLVSNRHQDVRTMRSRPSSSESRSSSSSSLSTSIITPPQLPPSSRHPIIASQEVPIRFGHNPHNPHALHGERGPLMLESLPEDRELPPSPKSDLDGAYSRRRSGSTASRVNRSARVYVPSPSGSPQSEASARTTSRFSRASLQSRYSSATLGGYLDELDVDYCLPTPTPESRSHPRTSISSMASLMTNASVDAVIPRGERPLRIPTHYGQRPLSLPDEPWQTHEPWSEGESQSEEQGDILDTYFYDLIGPHSPTAGYPETPRVDGHFSFQQSTCTYSPSGYSDRRSSFATTISSGSSSSGGHTSTSLSIKAMHEDNIVMLRLPCNISYSDLRRKIYTKFNQTDKATICESFAIALMEHSAAEGASSAKAGPLHFIGSQEEWEDVVALQGGKLLLRIIGSRE